MAWYVENDNNINLLQMIKSLRQHFHVKFMDIVLAALSFSLENYFTRKHLDVPDQLTVVLPVRMEIERIENNFKLILIRL